MKNVSVPVAATPNTGEAVRQLRAARGISVRGLAARIGVSPATISAIENGKTGISVQRLRQIAKALAVPAASLVEDPAASTQLRSATPSSVQLATGNWREFAPLPIDPVLAGAIKAFVATGYHGASMRSIAQFANMSVPGVYHHYPSKQDLLVKILDITMMDLLWRLQRARDDGNNPIERVALVVEALALFHTRRSDLSFINASEMRSLEPHHYRRIARLRDDVQDLLDTEIAAAITAGGLAVNHRRDVGKAITTMCTALVQWFQPDGRTTPEQIAKEYAQFALRLLGYNAMRQPGSRGLAPAYLPEAAGSSQLTARSSGRGTGTRKRREPENRM
jgi:AcrR family transcriptional regulator/transcriptional regulator with XRE-family HTH domain